MSLQQMLTNRLSERGQRALAYREADKEVVRAHLLELHSEFPSLNVHNGDFQYNNGSSEHLLKAEGTLPMYYKGSKYNIPICLWLPGGYPTLAPIVFVTPTSNMVVKRDHRFVEVSGAVHTQYLSEWMRSSNLVDMAQDLSIIFGSDPPLYAAPPGQTPPPVAYTPPPQQHQPMNTFNPAAHYHPPGSYPGYGGAAANPTTSGSPYTNAYHQRPQYPPPNNNPYQGPPSSSSNPYPPPHYSGSSQAPAPKPPNDHAGCLVAARDALMPHLTKRLQTCIKAKNEQLQPEFSKTAEQILRLKERGSELDKLVQSGNEERQQIEAVVGGMSSVTPQLDSWLQQHGPALKAAAGEDVDPDTAIVPVDALSAQALKAHAEDLALEDTLYGLERPLTQGVLDCDTFLKTVRNLSRKQFMARALCMRLGERQQEASRAEAQQSLGSHSISGLSSEQGGHGSPAPPHPHQGYPPTGNGRPPAPYGGPARPSPYGSAYPAPVPQQQPHWPPYPPGR